ncbi:MAG: UvrD-helicase domain-containing protein, partial [Bacteroidota bacterium]
PVEINITEEQIAKAESILLSDGESFDDERRDFIKNFQTIDLQAVPGSGKTTALLAKLLILEEFLPLPDNRGVLILSHTNGAVDEIRERIAIFCPKLFSYPNFVGTIQAFVDTFMCVPHYVNKHKRKPYRIDDEVYEQGHYMPHQCRGALSRRNDAEKILLKSRLSNEDDLIYGFGTIGNFPYSNKSRPTYRGLLRLKKELRAKGILCYDDAYILAIEYLEKFPKAKGVIQNRFHFVFVDEMQDMDKHQYDVLEALFFDGGNAPCVYQRIGDKNQSIFNGNVKLNQVWINRNSILNINGSHRLTPQVAGIIDCLAVERDEEFQVIGLRDGELKPHLLVYEDRNIDKVLFEYSNILNRFIHSGHIDPNLHKTFKAIAWRKIHEDDDKIALSDYYQDFSIETHVRKIDFVCLESYLINIDYYSKTLESARKNILNALIRILRLEDVIDSNGRYFTKRKLLQHLKEEYYDQYEDLKLHLYQWSMKLVKGLKEDVYLSVKEYLIDFLKIFEKEISSSENFINERIELSEADIVDGATQGEKVSNLVNYHGFDIEVSTVHGTKGQT